ncbi:hypothetical protein [Eoetvoesiella caeni]
MSASNTSQPSFLVSLKSQTNDCVMVQYTCDAQDRDSAKELAESVFPGCHAFEVILVKH